MKGCSSTTMFVHLLLQEYICFQCVKKIPIINIHQIKQIYDINPTKKIVKNAPGVLYYPVSTYGKMYFGTKSNGEAACPKRKKFILYSSIRKELVRKDIKDIPFVALPPELAMVCPLYPDKREFWGLLALPQLDLHVKKALEITNQHELLEAAVKADTRKHNKRFKCDWTDFDLVIRQKAFSEYRLIGNFKIRVAIGGTASSHHKTLDSFFREYKNIAEERNCLPCKKLTAENWCNLFGGICQDCSEALQRNAENSSMDGHF